MKECWQCRHYEEYENTGNAPIPLWLESIDPMSNLTGDKQRLVEKDTNAEYCKTFYRKRKKGK